MSSLSCEKFCLESRRWSRPSPEPRRRERQLQPEERSAVQAYDRPPGGSRTYRRGKLRQVYLIWDPRSGSVWVLVCRTDRTGLTWPSSPVPSASSPCLQWGTGLWLHTDPNLHKETGSERTPSDLGFFLVQIWIMLNEHKDPCFSSWLTEVQHSEQHFYGKMWRAKNRFIPLRPGGQNPQRPVRPLIEFSEAKPYGNSPDNLSLLFPYCLSFVVDSAQRRPRAWTQPLVL